MNHSADIHRYDIRPDRPSDALLYFPIVNARIGFVSGKSELFASATIISKL